MSDVIKRQLFEIRASSTSRDSPRRRTRRRRRRRGEWGDATWRDPPPSPSSPSRFKILTRITVRRARRIAFRTPRKLPDGGARGPRREGIREGAPARVGVQGAGRVQIVRPRIAGGGDAGVRTRRRDERATMVTMNTRTRSFCARRRVHLIRTHTRRTGARRVSSISSYPTVIVAATADPCSSDHVAEMAHGTATSGSAKCAVARTTPSAEFCMPTSIETVRLSGTGKPRSPEKPYPSASRAV